MIYATKIRDEAYNLFAERLKIVVFSENRAKGRVGCRLGARSLTDEAKPAPLSRDERKAGLKTQQTE